MEEVHRPLVTVRRLLLVAWWVLVFVELASNSSRLASGNFSPVEAERQQKKERQRQVATSRVCRVSAPLATASPALAEAVALQPARVDAEQANEPAFESARNIPPVNASGQPNYVAGRLIVRFRDGTTPERCTELITSQRAETLKVIDARRGEYLIAMPSGLSVPSAADQFASLAEVEYAEPNILYYTDLVPDDTLYTMFENQPGELQRWYYSGVGADYNLDAEAAWDITTGDSNVVIAVIDTGVLLNHPDLQANIWVNHGEIAGNGIDDDGNGYIDDANGWDFYNDQNDPNPDLGNGLGDHNVFHGTFVAGCAAAVSGNGLGVTGASWTSQLMPLKVFTSDGGAPASAIASALRYAADNGANIVNTSFSSPYLSKTVYAAAQYAWGKGLLLVASAGNGNSGKPQYPAHFKGVISVGGTGDANHMRSRASFSQFGPKAVDVVAPAVNLASTAVFSVTDAQKYGGDQGDSAYYYGSGTSFAAPLVSGEAALLMARARALGLEHSLSNEDYRQIILSATTDLGDDPTDVPDGGPKWDSHGRVDFYAAVQQINTNLVQLPCAPSKLMARATAPGVVQLTWVDNSDNEEGFRIERALKSAPGTNVFALIAELPPNATSFTDTTARPRSAYLYRVCSFNVAGESCARRPVLAASP
jgi:subtilisin family serine protease